VEVFMQAFSWPRLSVAAAMLPLIRGELLAHSQAPHSGPGPPIDVCAIVEDGLFGYELAPYELTLPFLIIGCAEDAIPRVRRTSFNPAREAGLRLATVHGRPIGSSRPRVRRTSAEAEIRFSGWATAVAYVWQALAPALHREGPQWAASMAACRSLENALMIAGLHLAEWDPAIDFCGLLEQAEFGLPLRGGDNGMGTLTLRRPDVWLLHWKSGPTIVQRTFPYFSLPEGMPTLLPRDALR
jgi:hypothetical protein